MTLTVKVYLNPDSNQQEIRRIVLYDGASTSYGSLIRKIEKVFPIVEGKTLQLFWKDAEDEMIAFSSSQELEEALESIKGDLFRVYVKVVDDAKACGRLV